MSELLTFKLNGQEVKVPKGWTVMQAATREGVKIPHFCWHPGLTVAGVCRFCMVKVEGRPKLEIACNLQVTEGMEVRTDTDEVQETHKWALEYHLVNHPLDCPICDQAGECGLQDYYMSVGKYKSAMTRPKVLKPKALDLGRELVLDTERCILCSRCVRFENEVTKTGALGIFDRGDRAVIGTYDEEKIDHHYQENLVDICPVGAFTSKKFRFKQRVWFLKERDAICPGCSTGCRISVHAKPEMQRYYRIKPRFDAQVNDHWMCDHGRTMFHHLNPEGRLAQAWLLDARGQRAPGTTLEGVRALAARLQRTPPQEIALLVSPQYTNEEYQALFTFFVRELGVRQVFSWRTRQEDVQSFDGILLRGDRNPNTRGLQEAMATFGVGQARADGNQVGACVASGASVVVALVPEILSAYLDLGYDLKELERMPFVSAWTLDFTVAESKLANVLPMKGFTEKRGTFTNYQGVPGVLADPYPTCVNEARDVAETVELLRSEWATQVGGQKAWA